MDRCFIETRIQGRGNAHDRCALPGVQILNTDVRIEFEVFGRVSRQIPQRSALE